MNAAKPCNYKQYDNRWGSIQYAAIGENTTIAESGCGPTCAADILTTLTGTAITPLETCQWSVANGFKAYRQGTYYSYFTPQFAKFGIRCEMLNWQDSYHNISHGNHSVAKSEVQKGNYVIALMKPGLWTHSGHFIVVYYWDNNGVVCINDPASNLKSRERTTEAQFKNDAAYYWIVDAVRYRKEHSEQKSMPKTHSELVSIIQNEIRNDTHVYDTINDVPKWYRPTIKELVHYGIIKGTTEQGSLNLSDTECRILTIIGRMFKRYIDKE